MNHATQSVTKIGITTNSPVISSPLVCEKTKRLLRLAISERYKLSLLFFILFLIHQFQLQNLAFVRL